MKRRVLAQLMAFLALAVEVQGQVAMETVLVGNPGNTSVSWFYSECYDSYLGAVYYVYRIGKFEVTAGQYTRFLNAVGKVDPYGLFNPNMWGDAEGCKIERTGSVGSYHYTVADDWADRPVNFVSWGDAARFANWLHNGQPGLSAPVPQDEHSTEDGAYDLTATQQFYGPEGTTPPWGTSAYYGLHDALMAAVRTAEATWAIPSEDEWYKAAYHYNDGPTANYYYYPTSTDTTPGCVDDSGSLSGTGTTFAEGDVDPGNYASYDCDNGTRGIGSPYYRTKVGEWENSPSPYGTFDQGGNVQEWNETVFWECDGPLCGPECEKRGVRGGDYRVPAIYLMASDAYGRASPASEWASKGFRLVEIPTPQPADLNGDGFVALDDHKLFMRCLRGPNESDRYSYCSPFLFDRADIDGDNDVDLADHASLMDRYTGK